MEQEENKRPKKPWPTKAAMEQVYALNLWGGNAADFFSGEGSHNPELLQPYLEVLISFLHSFNDKITVCDLGCGDFNVGKELVRHTKNYIAIDIVPSLIARNKNKFKQENLEFQCLDIAVDELPSGDCVLLRQVLQHLSNTEIHAVLPKLTSFKYVVLTEHLPKGNFVPNKDIISGQGIRLKKQSGIKLPAPPFNFKVGSQKPLLSVSLSKGKGVIVTTLYTLF